MRLLLAVVVACLYGVGTYLLLQRVLTRIVIGLALLGHGANLLLLVSGGRRGAAPILSGPEVSSPGTLSDPLPQALALTAIVISFGIVSFLLALSYRSWALTASDEVEDDVEDRRIARHEPETDFTFRGADQPVSADEVTGEGP